MGTRTTLRFLLSPPPCYGDAISIPTLIPGCPEAEALRPLYERLALLVDIPVYIVSGLDPLTGVVEDLPQRYRTQLLGLLQRLQREQPGLSGRVLYQAVVAERLGP
jgi:hypothetical protein